MVQRLHRDGVVVSNQGVVNGFEGESPFVRAAGGVAVAAALAGLALPCEDIVEGLSQQGRRFGDRGPGGFGVAQPGALLGVAVVAGGGLAVGLEDPVLFGGGSDQDAIGLRRGA